jgi:predicted negative regulator of RcsB-dependent stress response
MPFCGGGRDKIESFISEVFVARITRKELKTDKFALEMGHTFDFFEEHRAKVVRYGAIVAAVVVLVLGYTVYARHQRGLRSSALAKAILVQEASVGGMAMPGNLSFPTQEAKDQAAMKAFSEVESQYSGSDEAEIAEYYIGAIKADQGRLSDAEKSFLNVAQKGDRYGSLAKLSLAQIYFSDGRVDLAEKTLRELIARPTVFVSRDQATITLARYLMYKKPAEARKLLDPLRSQPGAAGQAAITLLGELPPQ